MKRGPVAWLIGAMGIWGMGTLVSSAGPGQAGSTPDKAAQVAAGRKVYEREQCATCHQIARQGNSRFPLDGVAARLSVDEIRRWITDTARMEAALPRMPAVRMSARKYHLRPADLDALVAYLQTLK